MANESRVNPRKSRGSPRKNRGKSCADGEEVPHRKTGLIIINIMFFNPLGVY